VILFSISGTPIGFKKSKTADKIPSIHLNKGTVEYSRIFNKQSKTIATLNFDANLRSSEKMHDGCSFRIIIGEDRVSGEGGIEGIWRPGSIKLAGGVSSIAVPALNRNLTAKNLEVNLTYDEKSDYSLKLSVKDLMYTKSDSLPLFADDSRIFPNKPGPLSAMERVFKRYSPSGKLDVEIETSGNLKNLIDSSVKGELYCRDLSVCDRKYPYPLEHRPDRKQLGHE